MIPFDENIRNSIAEQHSESLRSSMLAANASAQRWRGFEERVGRGLITVGERLAHKKETLAPRTMH